ncbi:hypothetical protein C4D60_Mb05t30080 [Musa balbisiana]|uniref:Sugar phosphate transporter domain-containing protein n=1 Tax=Musa balbisiana TaxID=52838 RepID=A0A4S8JZX3_MUSBA|nr:hypothetical protein C4D60_Mb05t30080 [Musa balbisiana]
MSAKVALSPALATGRFFTIWLVTAWYSSNIGVLLLNKYLLSNYGFKYPIFLTMCHMTACSLLSYVAIAWLKLVPMQAIRSRLQLLKIAALSLVFCGSVVSGNVSLRYLPVSFNQAVGATTPFFTAVFAYLMTLRRESWITYITLVPVVTGVIIASGVLGNAKGAVAVVISILIFRNPVSFTGMAGYTLTVIGVILYSESKKLNK